MQLFDVYPLMDISIVKGKGCKLWDDRGNEYLDLYGGHAVISVGHAHPQYVDAISKQVSELGFYSNSVKLDIQHQLASILGRVSRRNEYQLFLCNSGAEANENAIKLASFHTKRKKVVAFKGSFHGRTSLAVAATDSPALRAPVNETDNVIFLPFNDLAALEDLFVQDGNAIAAVITEGIQGVGGIIEASAEFLQAIRRLCDEHSAVFIADSVQCGYGRTGQFFAHDAAGVDADIYSTAKGMGNGFPVASILIAPHIKPAHGMLGTTFGGNPLACAAAIAVLGIMEQEQLMQQAMETGAFLKQGLVELFGAEYVRGRGLMLGVALGDSFSSIKKNLLHKHKIFTGEAKPGILRILPPLNVSREECQRLLDALAIEVEMLKAEVA